jgi:hypothetical protein
MSALLTHTARAIPSIRSAERISMQVTHQPLRTTDLSDYARPESLAFDGQEAV